MTPLKDSLLRSMVRGEFSLSIPAFYLCFVLHIEKFWDEILNSRSLILTWDPFQSMVVHYMTLSYYEIYRRNIIIRRCCVYGFPCPFNCKMSLMFGEATKSLEKFLEIKRLKTLYATPQRMIDESVNKFCPRFRCTTVSSPPFTANDNMSLVFPCKHLFCFNCFHSDCKNCDFMRLRM